MPPRPGLRATRRRVRELEAEVATLNAREASTLATVAATQRAILERVAALEAHAADQRIHLPRAVPR